MAMKDSVFVYATLSTQQGAALHKVQWIPTCDYMAVMPCDAMQSNKPTNMSMMCGSYSYMHLSDNYSIT